MISEILNHNISENFVHPFDHLIDVILPVASISTLHIMNPFFVRPPCDAFSLNGNKKLLAFSK
ncbi:hypothetical protein KFK09_008608 [Dendrobium nobile]|uniref:Uncharacterized protein n=1 Tax=Dendrobium nobile TaxID=94219 RepID=A0A8T3BLK6_DENNO|nr:hypothetical protein KFK09_008608 [Dendrobium nobile]